MTSDKLAPAHPSHVDHSFPGLQGFKAISTKPCQQLQRHNSATLEGSGKQHCPHPLLESSSGSPELTIFTDQLQTARQRGQETMGKMAGLITKARLPRPQAHRQPHVRLLDRSWTARHLQLTLRSRSHSLDRPTLADDIQLLLVGVDVPFM